MGFIIYKDGRRKRKVVNCILKSLKNGATLGNACDGAGISVTTLWHWRRRNPRLDYLVQTIYDSRIQLVEDALYKNAVEEGQLAAQIFILKNRDRMRWKEKFPEDEVALGKIQVELLTHKNGVLPSGKSDVIDVSMESQPQMLQIGLEPSNGGNGHK